MCSRLLQGIEFVRPVRDVVAHEHRDGLVAADAHGNVNASFHCFLKSTTGSPERWNRTPTSRGAVFLLDRAGRPSTFHQIPQVILKRQNAPFAVLRCPKTDLTGSAVGRSTWSITRTSTGALVDSNLSLVRRLGSSPSPPQGTKRCRHQKRDARVDAAEIKIVSGAVALPPSHEREQTQPFCDMRQHHQHEASCAKHKKPAGERRRVHEPLTREDEQQQDRDADHNGHDECRVHANTSEPIVSELDGPLGMAGPNEAVGRRWDLQRNFPSHERSHGHPPGVRWWALESDDPKVAHG